MSLEIINSVATVISSVMAFITVWLVVKHYNDSKNLIPDIFGIETIFLIIILKSVKIFLKIFYLFSKICN